MSVVESESKMISGDYNIVNCDFFVEYKISDPVKYLYNSENPREILKSLAQSHIRNVISLPAGSLRFTRCWLSTALPWRKAGDHSGEVSMARVTRLRNWRAFGKEGFVRGL